MSRWHQELWACCLLVDTSYRTIYAAKGMAQAIPGIRLLRTREQNFKRYESIGYLKRCWNVPCLAEGLISQIAILNVYEGLARNPALHSSGSNLLNSIPEARVAVNLPLK